MRALSRSHRTKVVAVLLVAAATAGVLIWPRDDGRPVAVETLNRPGDPLPPLPADGDPSPSTSTTEAPVTSPTFPTTTGPAGSGSTSTTARRRPPSPTTITTKPNTTTTGPLVIAQPNPTTTLTTIVTPVTRPQNPKAPRAMSMTVSPKELDTSAGPAKLTVRLRLVDDQGDADTSGTTVRFTNGDGFRDVPYEAWKRISGDGHDGTYEAAFDLQQHTAEGFWSFIVLRTGDQAGNAHHQWATDLPDADFDDGFRQLGPGDPDPPELKALTIAAGGSSSVTFTARITDAPAGVATTMDDRFDATGTVVSPSGAEYNVPFGWWQFTSGSKYDATYRFVLNLGPSAERGTWTIRRVHMGDILGNQTNLETAALAARGFPTTFVVGD